MGAFSAALDGGVSPPTSAVVPRGVTVAAVLVPGLFSGFALRPATSATALSAPTAAASASSSAAAASGSLTPRTGGPSVAVPPALMTSVTSAGTLPPTNDLVTVPIAASRWRGRTRLGFGFCSWFLFFSYAGLQLLDGDAETVGNLALRLSSVTCAGQDPIRSGGWSVGLL